MPNIWNSKYYSIVELVHPVIGSKCKVKEQDRGSNSRSHGAKAGRKKKKSDSVFLNSLLVLSFLFLSANGLCGCFERLTVIGYDC